MKPYLTPRDTWELVKLERGWEQLPGEMVDQMHARYASQPDKRPDRWPGESKGLPKPPNGGAR